LILAVSFQDWQHAAPRGAFGPVDEPVRPLAKIVITVLTWIDELHAAPFSGC
jgi:hypothetical protein